MVVSVTGYGYARPPPQRASVNGNDGSSADPMVIYYDLGFPAVTRLRRSYYGGFPVTLDGYGFLPSGEQPGVAAGEGQGLRVQGL